MNDVDKRSKLVIIVFVFGAELCNGSTADSDSVCEGSNPSSATTADDLSDHRLNYSGCGSVW